MDTAAPRNTVALEPDDSRPAPIRALSAGRGVPRHYPGVAGQVARSVHSTRIMNTLNTMVAVSLLTAGIPLFGCEQKPDRDATPTRQPGGVTNVQPRSSADPSTVERLSRARCEHEKDCNNVGGERIPRRGMSA